MHVYLPGSWYPLLLSMSFFILKYCLNVTYAIAPEMQANAFLLMTDVIASGLISGISAGRFVHIIQEYRRE